MTLFCFYPTPCYIDLLRTLEKISDMELLNEPMQTQCEFSHNVIVEDTIANINADVVRFGETVDVYSKDSAIELDSWYSDIWDNAYEVGKEQVLTSYYELLKEPDRLKRDAGNKTTRKTSRRNDDLPNDDIMALVEVAATMYARESVAIAARYLRYFEPFEVKDVTYLFHDDYLVNHRQRC